MSMRAMKIVMVAGLVLATTGCYSKYLMLQAEAVSMTRSDGGAVKRLKAGDEVSEKWCIGDEPLIKRDDKVVALADQVIYKAQDGGRRADFITDVQIFRDSKGCALLTGKVAKL